MKVAILNQQDKIKVGKPLKDLIKRSAEAALKFFDLRTADRQRRYTRP